MLLIKECKKILLSLTFLIYVAAVLAFYYTQFPHGNGETVQAPRPGQESYGYMVKEVPEILMPSAAVSLVREYLSGIYVAYPIGFYKEVKLSEKKSAEIAEIIAEMTGLTPEELERYRAFNADAREVEPDGNGSYYAVAHEPLTWPEYSLSETLTYERFRELMARADKIIGGGSRYSEGLIVSNFSRVPMTYEDALEEYHLFLEDKITGAYARLFCDYIGIVVSVLPVFVAAAFVSADRKSGMEQLVYSRKISSTALVSVRYLALMVMQTIPVLVLAVLAGIRVISLYPGETTDILAIPKLAVCWLLPNIMVSSALGMLLTEVLSPLAAVFVQGAWWVASVMGGAMGGLTGGIGRFTLVCRHSSLYDAQRFFDKRDLFVFNRIFYTALSVVIVLLTVLIYHWKRKGDFHVHHKNLGRKSKA